METIELKGKESGLIDPEKGAWAPLLWIFIHAIVEKTGNGQIGTVIDEIRELHWILSHIDTIIPCAICRIHCIEYKKIHHLTQGAGFKTVKNAVIGFNKDQVRKWVWEFHTAVNERLGKTVHVEYESVEPMYKDYDIRKLWKIVWGEIYPEVGRKGGLDADKMREFNRHVILWRGFTGN